MRILFDQGTPLPIRFFLDEHEISTASQQGWATLRNGDLLAAADSSGFDILLTTDKNLPHQQVLRGRRIAVIVLGQQQWPRLKSHIQRVVEADKSATPGSYTEADIPASRSS